jgi:hypothetical protein
MKMSCRIVDKEIACYTVTGGAPTSVFANSVYDANGVLIALYYTDPAGAVVDTSAGTVVAGSCPVASPDVEWEKLCDVQADGSVVEFLRRSITRFNPDGTVIDPVEVADFEVDKVTAYTITGTVGDCSTCPVSTPLGLITDLSLLG